MARVEGVTPSKVSEMTAEMGKSLVSGRIDTSGQLLLSTRDGAVIVAGSVQQANAGNLEFEQTFVIANKTWMIFHQLGTRALSVVTLDANGSEIEGDVTYLDNDNIRVDFYYPQTGTAKVWN